MNQKTKNIRTSHSSVSAPLDRSSVEKYIPTYVAGFLIDAIFIAICAGITALLLFANEWDTSTLASVFSVAAVVLLIYRLLSRTVMKKTIAEKLLIGPQLDDKLQYVALVLDALIVFSAIIAAHLSSSSM
jgi:hypothetical protein